VGTRQVPSGEPLPLPSPPARHAPHKLTVGSESAASWFAVFDKVLQVCVCPTEVSSPRLEILEILEIQGH
jgi:hypothetical protein